MNGIHDMGGMHGFGPIEIDPDEPVFHAAWEPRVRVLMSQSLRAGLFSLDAFRHGIERMAPAAYLATPYHERWLTSVEDNLLRNGWVDRAELDARIAHLRDHPDLPPPPATPVSPPAQAPAFTGGTTRITPRFAVGDRVIARNIHPVQHTRLPRYVRGRRGVINRVHAPEPLPERIAHGLGEHPEVVYSVRFEASELWGPSAEPRQTVSIDLWESYLDPAER